MPCLLRHPKQHRRSSLRCCQIQPVPITLSPGVFPSLTAPRGRSPQNPTTRAALTQTWDLFGTQLSRLGARVRDQEAATTKQLVAVQALQEQVGGDGGACCGGVRGGG
jgi:hypothetical protein